MVEGCLFALDLMGSFSHLSNFLNSGLTFDRMGSSAPLCKLVLMNLIGCMASGGGLIEDRHITTFLYLLIVGLMLGVVVDEIEADGADVGPKRSNFIASKVSIIKSKRATIESIMQPKS